MKTTIEEHNPDGTGWRDHTVYHMDAVSEHDYWPAVTDVPCPVAGCNQTVCWYEAGYVPGYRVCMQRHGIDPSSRTPQFLVSTIAHRFIAKGNAAAPTLVQLDQ